MAHKICCVPGCEATSEDGVPLHRFPYPDKDHDRLINWLKLINRMDLMEMDKTYLYNNRRVCRRHFEPTYLYPKNKLCRLAVPKLFIPVSDHSEEVKVIKDHNYGKKRLSVPVTQPPTRPAKVAKKTEELSTCTINPIEQDDLGDIQDDSQSTLSEPEEPDIDFNMCRICVQSFSKLISLESYGLRTAYEQVTGVSVEHDDGLPRELCVECATLLDKYHRFRDKAIRGDLLLRQIHDMEDKNQLTGEPRTNLRTRLRECLKSQGGHFQQNLR